MKLNIEQKKFFDLAQSVFEKLEENENLALALHGESSHFCRVNNSKIRQNGDVLQCDLRLTYTKDLKKISKEIPYQNDLCRDQVIAMESLSFFRSEVNSLQQDPFFVDIQNNGESSVIHQNELLPANKLVPKLLAQVGDVDLAGILTSGQLIKATANSKGEKHWFETGSFYFDYSLYTKNQKAVKGLYAATKLDENKYQINIKRNKNELALLEKESKSLEKGSYKTYLAPAAVAEIVSMFSYGGFGQSALKRGQSPIKDLRDGTKKLSAKFNLNEDFSLGFNPLFNSFGELAPENLPIIEKGELKNLLVSTRSSKEYNVSSNGADSGEPLRSASIKPGTLEEKNILKELGTGLYINNLHYLNWSDLQGARFTGMTRFATFWVEKGEIISPINDLRFDETLYNVFGDKLIDLTTHVEVFPNLYTYEKRGIGGMSVPGILLDEFTFTL